MRPEASLKEGAVVAMSSFSGIRDVFAEIERRVLVELNSRATTSQVLARILDVPRREIEATLEDLARNGWITSSAESRSARDAEGGETVIALTPAGRREARKLEKLGYAAARRSAG